ncbi:MAG TPA: hypothetical protein VFJ01_03635 [Oleiagrimonas sp.]|nr:hypothetical protein [Oleiagrimonas sp.]
MCLALLAWCGWAHAAIDLTVARITAQDMQLKQVHLRLDQNPQGSLRMTLTAAGVDMPTVGWRHVGMRLTGTVTRGGKGIWTFDGHAALQGAPGGLLADSDIHVVMDAEANNLDVAVVEGATRVDAALPLDQPSHARIKLDKLPLQWLQGLLAKAWSGRLTGGSLSGTLALDVASDGIRSSGDLSLSQAGFEGEGGKLAGQGLNASGRMTLDTTGANDTINADLNLHDGQLLLNTLYADLPDHDVHLAIEAVMQKYGTTLRTLRFTDPNTLHFNGTMVLANDGSVRNIHMSRFSASLPGAYQRYGKSWLATLGFANLTTSGRLDGGMWLDANGWRAFHFNASDVNIRGNGRLAVEGLNGGFDWSREHDRPATTLGWQKLDFYRIALGAAKSQWQSRQGRLSLLAPLSVPVLGGHLFLRELDWSPQAKGQHLQTSLAITGVDVRQLCDALGWPKFSGTLAGAIPGLRYADDHVELEGGLTLNVFDGFVNVTRLSLQHPFGSAPVLAGDINMQRLDLASLTSVFDFGRITGRLDGHVDNLRMVDWSPVAFKASLRTEGEGRISQRAVKNLTSVGGGGMAAGLQGAVLKLFDSFGYQRIGLSCTLEGAVCQMSGLEPVDDGYLIVDGRGLPHLTVIGHQHQVSWPTLVARLKAAIHGGGPVIK